MLCSMCRTMNPDDARFCGACRTPLPSRAFRIARWGILGAGAAVLAGSLAAYGLTGDPTLSSIPVCGLFLLVFGVYLCLPARWRSHAARFASSAPDSSETGLEDRYDPDLSHDISTGGGTTSEIHFKDR